MTSLVLTGDTSGQVTLAAPAVAGTNTATLPVATGELSMLGGTGQTWQNLTGSRALSTTYTNTTGKPIVVLTWATTTGSATIITVSGVSAGWAAGSYAGATAIIPVGASYSVTGPTMVGWSELR